jgi:hypothetical protein
MAHINLTNRAGIKSIRFRGTPKMGMVTMGEWPDREVVKIKGPQKMNISGPDGERILKVKVAFHRLHQQDLIVGLSVDTSFGRNKRVISSELCPERPIHLADNVRSLECAEVEEIVGFHAIVSVCIVSAMMALLGLWLTVGVQDFNLHDIGLVLRRTTA